jgi:oligopeptidase B
VAPRIPWADTLHGEVRTDDYHWLRERESPEVRAYLQAENAYTDSGMAHTRGLREKLYTEMVARMKETDIEVPYLKDGWHYYTRTEKDKQYPIFCRKQGSLEAPEQIVLEMNELAEGKPYLDIGAFTVSDDGKLLAYSTDETGFRQYDLRVKDLASGATTAVLAAKTGSVAWAADNRTLFYTVEDEAKRQYRLYRHELGGDAHDLVHEETDESFSVRVYRGRSRMLLYLLSGSLTTSEWRFLEADRPEGAWHVVEPRRKDIEYSVEDDRERFYITVNDTGRTFRLVTAPIATPGREHWTEVLPTRADVMLEGLDLFARWSVRYERAEGLPRLIVTETATGEGWPIEFPEPAYTVFPARNAEFETDVFRYVYTSMVTPRSTFEYAFPARASTLRKQQEVLGGYTPEDYRAERIFATAGDGTRIPISLVYLAGVPRDGSAGCVLEGYGAYGYPSDPYFSSPRLSLIDRGVIFAVAHVRGGGEMGKPWHDAGRMMKKMNTFTDFIACAETLVEKKYTSPGRLVAEGGSAGGLLMGVVLNLRPELFHAVVLEVPFVDVINTMADSSLPLTVGQYEEWGNPADPEQYRYMRQYSPYDNLARRAYPGVLVRTALQDSQVMYWEPAKFVARLRTLKENPDTPLYLQTNMDAGHGGASGRYDYLKEAAFTFSFVLDELGIGE